MMDTDLCHSIHFGIPLEQFPVSFADQIRLDIEEGTDLVAAAEQDSWIPAAPLAISRITGGDLHGVCLPVYCFDDIWAAFDWLQQRGSAFSYTSDYRIVLLEDTSGVQEFDADAEENNPDEVCIDVYTLLQIGPQLALGRYTIHE